VIILLLLSFAVFEGSTATETEKQLFAILFSITFPVLSFYTIIRLFSPGATAALRRHKIIKSSFAVLYVDPAAIPQEINRYPYRPSLLYPRYAGEAHHS
jgi:hypothetical protein